MGKGTGISAKMTYEWSKSKTQKITNIGEDEKLKSLCTVGGTVKC